jgi:hypothetical protein
MQDNKSRGLWIGELAGQKPVVAHQLPLSRDEADRPRLGPFGQILANSEYRADR